MKDLLITIHLENAAFQGSQGIPEIVRLLRDVAKKIEDEGLGDIAIMDVNGNCVGRMNVL
jgi:hypothetical protein